MITLDEIKRRGIAAKEEEKQRRIDHVKRREVLKNKDKRVFDAFMVFCKETGEVLAKIDKMPKGEARDILCVKVHGFLMEKKDAPFLSSSPFDQFRATEKFVWVLREFKRVWDEGR